MTIAFGIGALLAVAVGIFAHLVGYDRDRAFYATVLTVVGLLYVLFAVIAGGRGVVPEIAFFAIFAAIAAIGFRTRMWIVAAGLALHGIFDFVRHAYLAAPGAPVWWPAFCGAYDIVAALVLAALLMRERLDQRSSPIVALPPIST